MRVPGSMLGSGVVATVEARPNVNMPISLCYRDLSAIRFLANYDNAERF